MVVELDSSFLTADLSVGFFLGNDISRKRYFLQLYSAEGKAAAIVAR